MRIAPSVLLGLLPPQRRATADQADIVIHYVGVASINWKSYRTLKAERLKVYPYRAVQVSGEGSFKQCRSKAASCRHRDRWATAFTPPYAELRIQAICAAPINSDASFVGRESPVFPRVSTELVKSHRDRDCLLWGQQNLRSGERYRMLVRAPCIERDLSKFR